MSANKVAAISFLDNHGLSVDVETVNQIEVSRPMRLEEQLWSCELLIRTANGTVALNLLSDDPGKLCVTTPDEVWSDE